MPRVALVIPLVAALAACGSSAPPAAVSSSADAGGTPIDAGVDAAVAFDGAPMADASPSDATSDAPDDAGDDAGNGCSVDGNLGQCITVSACAAMPGYSSTPGYCPGPASIECCAPTPNVANNPPTPAGYVLMADAQVTPDMTAWAVAILNDPASYPMFATATRVFGTQTVLARVEWHPPDFQNNVVHRGVTLYVPISDAGP
jgi:hypothetical protein